MTNEEITQYIFLNDADVKADVAIVFGTWNAWTGSVEKAVKLYRQELVSKVLFTGGLSKETGIVEGQAMAEEALTHGIPAKDIYIESRATNTLENVLYSLPLIDKGIGLQNVKTIAAVAKNFHARRCLMTLRKHVPGHIQLKSAAYVSPFYDFTKDNWMHSQKATENVWEELKKIKTYLAKGDLAEL